MPDATLVLLFDEIRSKTLRLLDGLTDAQARFAPPATSNTILWHAGHAYCVVEWLANKHDISRRQFPAGWFEMFSWESKPATVPADRWPKLADVVTQLRAQHERLRPVVAGFTDAQLEAPAAGDTSGRVLRYLVLHGLHDEANHQGEIYLLKKLQGLAKK